MKFAKWADRGNALHAESLEGSWARCVGASRLGSMESSGQQRSVWMQMRGSSWIEAKEGRFFLSKGDWIAFAKDSGPIVQTDKGGVCIGLLVAEESIEAMSQLGEPTLHIGQGRLTPAEIRTTGRLWCQTASHLSLGGVDRFPPSLRPLLLHIAGIQSPYAALIGLCPGTSLRRKRQVFDRLQRAQLYLAGNCHRVVRMSELAEKTTFSTWYLSKIFNRLYGQSPQTASARMRLEQAANLLASTNMAIAEVGVSSGFENNCSFARSFRARYGMTATTYRGIHRHRDQSRHMRPSHRVRPHAITS